MNKFLSYLAITLLLPNLVFGQSLDSQFQNPTHLSDKDMAAAKEFVHQGIKDKTIKEGCAGVNNCKDDDSGVLLEQVIGKAYALFGVVSGSGGILPTLTKKTTEAPAKEATPGEKSKQETENDYCMMIAMAYETVGGFLQQNLQKKAENSVSNVSDAQLQSLISLKEMHKARRSTATMQSTIYGGVTACYAAYALSGKAATDWKFWAKVGGSTALTALYLKKRNKHADAMKKVQKIIDSLPKSGDCNPWTGTSCFCSEASSKELYPLQYQEVCVLNAGNFDTPKQNLGCAAVSNNKLEFDQDCKCKATNSCYKARLSNFTNSVPAVGNLINQANKGFELLNNGLFDEGKLSSYSTDAAAFASGFKGKLDPKTVPTKPLSEEAKKIADELSPHMPASLASLAATSDSKYSGGIPETDFGSSKMGSLTPEVKAKLAEAINVEYQQGGGAATASTSEPDFTMPKLPGTENAQNKMEVLTFAEQALEKADVSNTPDTPIFDIISNRYKRSGWGKLNSLEK